MVVLHKALQLNPQFCSGILDPQFIKQATLFYYRFIHRRQNMLSIQTLTSVGQKLPLGWQEFCEENHIYISPTKRGLTLKEQVLDQAPNDMVH